MSRASGQHSGGKMREPTCWRERGEPTTPVDEERVYCSKNKCVALTFDDGPTPFTDRLLQELAAKCAKATFFLIGNKVTRRPRGGQAHR
jgi:peptidoglycan/xylan/chitin deacetylase (PgdA/CDA1 family)